MSASDQAQDPRTFEKALSDLEERVRHLDSGELPLEKALTVFEEGVSLVRECHELLDSAEQRIVELTATSDDVAETARDAT